VLYLQALGFPKDMLVQAMGTFFAISTFMLTISPGRNSLLGGDNLKLSAAALIPSIIGLDVGRWTRDQVDEVQFQKIFLYALLILGSCLVWRSALAGR
jgi:uncharacterized membrane protein YfcA